MSRFAFATLLVSATLPFAAALAQTVARRSPSLMTPRLHRLRLSPLYRRLLPSVIASGSICLNQSRCQSRRLRRLRLHHP